MLGLQLLSSVITEPILTGQLSHEELAIRLEVFI